MKSVMLKFLLVLHKLQCRVLSCKHQHTGSNSALKKYCPCLSATAHTHFDLIGSSSS